MNSAPPTRAKRHAIVDMIKALKSGNKTASKSPSVGTRQTQSMTVTQFQDHPLFLELRRQERLARQHQLQNPYYLRFTPGQTANVIRLGERTLSNYTSYDYCGLNYHPTIQAAAAEALAQYGTSVNGSRLTSGERQIHYDLEQALARHYHAEDAVIFASGHAGALTAISTLAQAQDLILYDAFAHNCITLGAKYAGAARRAFDHNNLNQLSDLLARERHQFRRVFIISEGLFSMDGDAAPLSELIALKERYDCVLMIDDAHGLGVLGQNGRGVFEAQGIDPSQVDLWFGTLSKSLVSAGGYLAGPLAATAILRAFAPGLVYTVGLSPVLAATALAALQLIAREPERIQRQQNNTEFFIAEARRHGLDTGLAQGAGIVPLMFYDTKQTLKLWKKLQDANIAAFPVLPPGVPMDTARLRFFITADHTQEQIKTDLAQLAYLSAEM